MNRASSFTVLFLVLLACSLGCASIEMVGTGGAGGTGGAPATMSSSSSTEGSGGAGGVPCVPIDDNNPCTDDLCNNGLPVHPPTPAGAPCSMGGSLCDGMGVCVECLAPTDCAGMDDVCQMRSCTQGKCGTALAPAGTSCD